MTDHSDHHCHLVGARVVCSCGEPRGLVTTRHTPSQADVCEVCHKRGVLAYGVPSAFRIPEPEPYEGFQPMSAEDVARKLSDPSGTHDG